MATDRIFGNAHSPPTPPDAVTNWYEIDNADDVPSPTLLIYPDRIEENLRRMIKIVGDPSRLRPHVKTHKLPQVIEMKVRAGIRKFKASTIAEAEMTAAAGGDDVLIAYPCVGPNVPRLIGLIQTYPQTRFATLVDNQASLQTLSDAAVAAGVEVTLLIDLNVGMNRTGIEPGPEAVELYRQLDSMPGVVAGGLHAYDGHLKDPDHDALSDSARPVRDKVGEMIKELERGGLEVPRLIAGGTPTLTLWATESDAELGAGTTVLWDFGQAEVSPDLDYLNAAVLLARVVSRPTPDRLCLDLGYKAVAAEMPQPRVRWFTLEDAEPVQQSEEHLVLQTDRAADYPVGTVMYGIPRHICPTVALQSEVWCVRDGIAQETWPVVARARRITI